MGGHTMFFWVREFVEDLGSTTTAGIGLVAGLLIGAAVTVHTTAGTPYSQADLDRVSATTSHVPEPQAAVDTRNPSAGDVRSLKRRAATLGDKLETAQGTIEELRGQLDTLQADSTAAPEPSPSASADVAPATGSGLTVSGTLDTTWILSAQLKPWPADCSDVAASYQVRINTGDHATVAIGSIVSAQVTKRTEKGGLLTLGCRATYRATLPDPLGAVYEFVAISTGTPEEPLDTALVQQPQVAGGNAPDLYVSFCPEC